MPVQVIHIGATPPPANPGNQPAAPTPGPAAKRLWARVRPYAAIAGIAVLSAVLACGLTAWLLGPGFTPGPSDARPLGRSYAPKLAAALADGFDADADALAAGKSFGDANTALKRAFHDAAEAAFEKHAGSAITALIPDGTEIKDQAQRDALEAFHRDFARGLRQSR